MRALGWALRVIRRKDHEPLPSGSSQSNRRDKEANEQSKGNVLSPVSGRLAEILSLKSWRRRRL